MEFEHFQSLLEDGPHHDWRKGSGCRLRPRAGLDSSIPLPEPGPSCSVTSCVAQGQCQVEPGLSISRPEDNQGCLSQIKCWQLFRHIYHNIGIEHSVQLKLKFKKKELSEKKRDLIQLWNLWAQLLRHWNLSSPENQVSYSFSPLGQWQNKLLTHRGWRINI